MTKPNPFNGLSETKRVKEFLKDIFSQCKSVKDADARRSNDDWVTYSASYPDTKYNRDTFRAYHSSLRLNRKREIISTPMSEQNFCEAKKLVHEILMNMTDSELAKCKPSKIMADTIKFGYTKTLKLKSMVEKSIKHERTNRGLNSDLDRNSSESASVTDRVREFLSKYSSAEILEISTAWLFRQLLSSEMIPKHSTEQNVRQILRTRQVEARYELEIESLKAQLRDAKKSQPTVQSNGSVRDMILESFESCRGDVEMVEAKLLEEIDQELNWIRRMQKIVKKM